ncbi:hypothetical protein C4559_04660 [Candidatus Microgenomates bacterium]|nr:MAG: hypothetical protein C4559_04660 [Candidatus Microgenomates bacterium]
MKNIKNFIFISQIFLSFLVFPQTIFAASMSAAPKIAGNSANIEIKSNPIADDNREKILKKFLEKYNSPLKPVAKTFIAEADKNKLDWRLVAAISGVESTFGKEIPYNSYNAWGWGIYGDNMIRFSSFDEGITVISKGLRDRYIDSWGAKDVYQIGRYYAASPTWAQRVDYFMQKMEEFAINNPENALSLSL